MTWLARLKKQKAHGIHPAEPTKPGFVGFVGTPSGHIQKIESNAPAANEPAPDLDRFCWPHSTAMTGREIDTFMARLSGFTDKGIRFNDGEALADKLVTRDRETDDRRVCLECRHFTGDGAASWRCGNWQAAGIPLHPHKAQLPADLVVQLQRCDGFTAHPTFIRQGTEDEHAPH